MNRSHPLRVGLFAIGALLLLLGALVVVSGGRLTAKREAAELHFAGSVYGLQPGAPVVFRGVRVGSVLSVDVVDDGSATLAVPVRVEIDRTMFMPADAKTEPPTLHALVQRGLSARLQTQSLLTGLLYVDLQMGPPPKSPPAAAAPVRIPTQERALGWQAQLDALDFRQLAADVSAAAAAAKQLLADPALRQAAAQMAQAGESLARAGNTLDKRLPALADGVQATVGKAGDAAAALAQAAQQLGHAAEQVGVAANRAQNLLAPDSPMLASVRRAADELGRSATALQRAAADDGALMQNLDGTLAEMKRASRSVRELAELLERHPEALLRGKPEGP